MTRTDLPLARPGTWTWQRRILIALIVSLAIVLVYGVLYRWGMGLLEGRQVSFIQSLQVVVEAITTSGFGGHAPWSSDLMNLMVLAMNLTGVAMVFMAVPLFVFPLLQEAFERAPPSSIKESGHFVLCAYTERVAALMRELDALGRTFVIVEPDGALALRLHREGHRVIHGDPEQVEVLRRASVLQAHRVVVDAADDVSISVVLSVRELAPDVQIVTVVDDETLEPYHLLAGATRVLSPRQLLGRSLARQVPFQFQLRSHPGVEVGKDLELAELNVTPGSDVCNRSVEEAHLRERFGVDIIAAWFEGIFRSPVPPDAHLDTRTRLLVAGGPEAVERFREAMASGAEPMARRRVVIVGHGRSGSAAARALSEARVRLTIVDAQAKEGVDVVGDARDVEVYHEARIETAAAAIIDLDDDRTAILSTLIVREANPRIQIIVRANAEASVGKLYRAGGDYVQSLATITGRMMASATLEEEEVIASEGKVEVIRLGVGRLAGRSLVQGDVRARTGSTVVGVVRGGVTITRFDPNTLVLEEQDELILVGRDEDIQHFKEVFLR